MKHETQYEDLDSLSDWELENEAQDIRGMPLVDTRGDKIGTISDLLVSREEERVLAVRLEDERICSIEPLDIHDNCVVYGERAVTAAANLEDSTAQDAREERIPVIEEKLVIGKRLDTDGKSVHVRTRVVEDQVSEDVTLRKEHVDVERRPVGEKLSADDADQAFKERDVTMTERSEEAVVGKEARVTEEVVVSKSAKDKTKPVSETVRRTEVDVDKIRDQKKRR